MSTPFNDLLATVASWLLVGCASWLLLICGAALLEARTAGRLQATAWMGCPPSLRRALLAALGVTLVATPSPAHPATGSGSPDWISSPTGASAPHPALPVPALPVPARPVGSMRGTSVACVLVRPGDTLWRLAEHRLPATALPAAVADLVERLHRRNWHVIGPDPDLIHPGQRLVVPAPQPPEHPRHRQEHP